MSNIFFYLISQKVIRSKTPNKGIPYFRRVKVNSVSISQYNTLLLPAAKIILPRLAIAKN